MPSERKKDISFDPKFDPTEDRAVQELGAVASAAGRSGKQQPAGLFPRPCRGFVWFGGGLEITESLEVAPFSGV